VIYKTLHQKLKIEQQQPSKKPGGSLRCSRTKNLEAHSGAPEQKTWRFTQVLQNKKPGGSLRCSRTKNLEVHSGAPEQKTWRFTQVLHNKNLEAHSDALEQKTWRLTQVPQNKTPGCSLRCSRTKNLEAYSGAPEGSKQSMLIVNKNDRFIQQRYEFYLNICSSCTRFERGKVVGS
jgi:hypothetical protein